MLQEPFISGADEIIDEMSEIAPAFTSGKIWKQIKDLAIDLKECRKCMLNIHSNTQSVSDIDHRVRSKVMIKIIYLVLAVIT